MAAKVGEFSERLRRIMEERGMTQSELAQLSGVSKSSISRYISGAWKGKQDTVYNLAHVLNVSEAWLMGYDVPMERPQPVQSTAALLVDTVPNLLPLPKTRKVPRLGTIACGEPILAQENIENYDKVPEGVNCDFTLKCKGDSMTGARIHDGDIVYIRLQEEVENGEIAAVLVDDSGESNATLKRVYLYENQIVLQAENPKYSPWVYTGEDMNKVRIIGKAVAFLSEVR